MLSTYLVTFRVGLINDPESFQEQCEIKSRSMISAIDTIRDNLMSTYDIQDVRCLQAYMVKEGVRLKKNTISDKNTKDQYRSF